MPYKPMVPCRKPRCPNLCEPGKYYCNEHLKEQNKYYERYQRDPEAKARYGKEWRVIRNAYISIHPLCEDCLEGGRYTKATEVHHIKALADGGTHEHSNLRSLCHECHSRISAVNGQRWGRKK